MARDSARKGTRASTASAVPVAAAAGAPALTASSVADRVIVWASAAVALAAIAARVHAVVTVPPLRDYDASGHAVNVLDLLEGHLPNPRSWCGSHPPLYYGISAVLWTLLPDAIPVHLTMRLISVAAFVAMIGLVWRTLRRLGSEVDAAVVAALLLGVPGFAITAGMTTNDALCAFFVTATLVRVLEASQNEAPSVREAALTGLLAGLAAVTKATGLAAVGLAGAMYAWHARHDVKRSLPAVLAFGATSLAIMAPHYGHLFVSVSGSPYKILAARAGSQEKEAIATIVEAVVRAGSGLSPLALLHAAIWGDPTAAYYPRHVQEHPLARAVSAGGLIITGLAVAGAARILMRRELLRSAGVALFFGAAYAMALLPHAVDNPYVVLTKTNYLLLEALPLGILVAAGLGSLRAGLPRTALQVTSIAVAAAGVALTTYGWWDEGRPPSRQVPQATAHAIPAAATVQRYFKLRAQDPVRALSLLGEPVQREHGLRMIRLLGLPPLAPEVGYSADAERSLELARARVAWLESYNLIRWMQPIAGALAVRVLEAQETDGTAHVTVVVEPVGTAPPHDVELGLWPFPSFEQRFVLERHGDAWRIVGVEQRGVRNENALQAFVAHPTLAGFDHLRAIGWQPPWEPAIAPVLRSAR